MKFEVNLRLSKPSYLNMEKTLDKVYKVDKIYCVPFISIFSW